MAHREEGKYAPLRTKILWTVLFLALFLAGRSLELPLMHATGNDLGDLSTAAGVATGGNFKLPVLFSLGLGPYMAANIIWRFTMIDRLLAKHNIPKRTGTIMRYVVMGGFALFQAISLTGNFRIDPVNLGPFDPETNGKILAVIMLCAGAALLIWLANLNQELGLGGITAFIMYQLILTAWTNREQIASAFYSPDANHILIPVGIACLLVIILSVFFGNSEVRLKVNKVSIDNGFTGQSYLPIKLNPAGPSPIMYAMTALTIPVWIAKTIAILFPSTADGVGNFLGNWGLSRPLGFVIYLVLLFVMAIFFGLFNVGPGRATERMQNNGEYFSNVVPGEASTSFLRRNVVVLAVITGILLVILCGLPLFFMGKYPQYQYILMAPGTLMILISMFWMLKEEIDDTMIGRKYKFELMAAQQTTAKGDAQ